MSQKLRRIECKLALQKLGYRLIRNTGKSQYYVKHGTRVRVSNHPITLRPEEEIYSINICTSSYKSVLKKLKSLENSPNKGTKDKNGIRVL